MTLALILASLLAFSMVCVSAGFFGIEAEVPQFEKRDDKTVVVTVTQTQFRYMPSATQSVSLSPPSITLGSNNNNKDTSHSGAGSFVVPLPVVVASTGPGGSEFHQVYHPAGSGAVGGDRMLAYTEASGMSESKGSSATTTIKTSSRVTHSSTTTTRGDTTSTTTSLGSDGTMTVLTMLPTVHLKSAGHLSAPVSAWSSRSANWGLCSVEVLVFCGSAILMILMNGRGPGDGVVE